jgi:phenylalanyl-tRNA synthetase beta chain
MIVSWNWLKDYLKLEMSEDELTEKLTMAGLNFEGAESIGEDRAIDLEVTSNRPDWLGHIGVAREIGVLYDLETSYGKADVAQAGPSIDGQLDVVIEADDFCPRYTARIIRGVKVGPSPAWLADRLTTMGISVINNVVDITNYVLMESAQPLHAFDLAKLSGDKITVRSAIKGEKFDSLDHKAYDLLESDYVIADANGPVALAGVMGGASSEVTDSTTDLLIEAADFAALPVRTTSRRLKLRSDSSYRFERGVDPEMIDWASRRCCELILEIAGGQVDEGSIYAGNKPEPRESVTLRYSLLKRILGIDVPEAQVHRILEQLGNAKDSHDGSSITVIPPTWRRDLTREIDLVEEVARVYGYDKIPADKAVKMAASHKSDEDRVRDKTRTSMIAAGFNEAVTRSVVSQDWANAFQGWSTAEPLQTSVPMLRGEDRLRLSLMPSLLGARRSNEKAGNQEIELYEIAKVYLPKTDTLPDEQYVVSISSGKDFYGLKGVIEALVAKLNPNVNVDAAVYENTFFEAGRGCQLSIDGETLGYLGQVSTQTAKAFDLQSESTVAEIKFSTLQKIAQLIPQHQEFSSYPTMSLDLNMIADEATTWADLESTVKQSGSELLESVEYRETFRNEKKDGAGKKRILLSLVLRSADRTLTGEEAESARDQIVAACEAEHSAKLLG